MQRKLHHWAVSDPDRRFDDVFNLVHHPDFLTVAWERVRGNKGARTAGVDRVSPASIAEDAEVVEFLGQVREQLKSRTFAPLPVRERLIPKPNSSKLRRLGIPTAMDRVVQASLVLVLEPIFEADFKPVSYGFRPDVGPRTRSLRFTPSAPGTITGCSRLTSRRVSTSWRTRLSLDRVRLRIADKRVLALIKAFLKAGVMSADGTVRDSDTGTPQGGIVSPLLANIALSVLDEHFCAKWDAHAHPSARGAPQTWRGHLSDRPLRGRLRDHGGGNQSARGCALGRKQGVQARDSIASRCQQHHTGALGDLGAEGGSELNRCAKHQLPSPDSPSPGGLAASLRRAATVTQHPWLYRSPSNPHAMPNRVNPGICRPAAANSDE